MGNLQPPEKQAEEIAVQSIGKSWMHTVKEKQFRRRRFFYQQEKMNKSE